ncbi:MAG: glycosyltransferase, partial [Lentisphaerae bacterium]|nr:glycosyltransferase [Lentisphaerota bacterium]
MSRKLISITSGCFNEEQNLVELWERLKKVFENEPAYDFELIITDNCSTDRSREVLRRLASEDSR